MQKYKTITNGQEIAFRSMTMEEADRFFFAIQSNIKNSEQVEEHIFKAILETKDLDIDSLNAGIVPIIIYCSFHLSGFFTKEEDIPNKIELVRDSVRKNFYYTLYSAILKTQPRYTIEELKEKTLNQILELFALSEIILGKDILNTGEMKKTIGDSKNISATNIKNSKKGLKSITEEEINLVKKMIMAEEFNSELN